MSNRPERCQELLDSEVVISDHKVLEFELAVDTPYDFSTGMLKKKPRYPKPEAVATDVWRAHLHSVWQDQSTSETRLNLQKGLQDETTKVSEEWTTFQRCVEDMLKQAYADALASGWAVDDEEEGRMKQELLKNSRKGGEVKHVKVRTQQKWESTDGCSRSQRKRKAIARCWEANKVLGEADAGEPQWKAKHYRLFWRI